MRVSFVVNKRGLVSANALTEAKNLAQVAKFDLDPDTSVPAGLIDFTGRKTEDRGDLTEGFELVHRLMKSSDLVCRIVEQMLEETFVVGQEFERKRNQTLSLSIPADIMAQVGDDWVTKLKNYPIEQLGLTVRSYNGLKRVHINTLLELVQQKPGRAARDKKPGSGLLGIPDFGKKSFLEVIDLLHKKGLYLEMMVVDGVLTWPAGKPKWQ